MKMNRVSLFLILCLWVVNTFAMSTRLAEKSQEETERKNLSNMKNMKKLMGNMERSRNPLRQDWFNSKDTRGTDTSTSSTSAQENGDVGDTPDVPILRFVTYNVGDNGAMVTKGVAGFKDDLGFIGESVDRLLGIHENGPVADIFAIGLQEECWKCNTENLPLITRFFLGRLASKGDFVKVALKSTRGKGDVPCENGCIGKSSSETHHGTTLMLVLAKRGVVDLKATLRYSYNGKPCSDREKRGLPPNDEKGVAMVRFKLAKSGKTVTVATSHLDSDSPAKRRECLKGYFNIKNSDTRAESDFEFLSGDLNMRTSAYKSKDNTFKHYSGRAEVASLAIKDELVGSDPWTSDKLDGNMLTFINTGIDKQKKRFQEGDWNFMPTYKIAAASNCNGAQPCYSEQRAISWTDRIIYTAGTCTKYSAMFLEDSDHYPVTVECRLG